MATSDKLQKTHIHHIARGKNVEKRIPNYDAVVDRVKHEWLKEIESERRRLSKVDVEIPRPKNRELGKTDWTDLPQNVPYQKLALDKLGLALCPNAPYICPNCKTKYLGYPPEYCACCRKPTFLHSLNMRR